MRAVLRHPRRPAFGPFRFDIRPFNATPPEVGRPRHARVPAVFSLCVHRAWRAPRRSSRFTPARAGHCTAVSLPRGVPLPSLRTLARPGRTASSSVRRRSWDFVDPSQCSLSAGPGVCDTTPFDLGAVGSVSAVHPHLPFSTSFRIPLIFTVVGRAKENLRTPSQRAWLAGESSSQASFA
jgi:hypothetical protein